MIAETLDRLATRDDLDIVAYGWPLGGRSRMDAALPDGVRSARLPMAGPPMRAAWRMTGLPPIELWTGRVDVVHGPNYVVPPTTKRAIPVVTIHDLTVMRHPEFCTADTLEFPDLVRRSVRSGAWIHTVSDFVASEIVEMLGVDPERVVTVHNGVVSVPEVDPAEGRRIAGTDRYLLALGTIEPRKDLPTLVRAFDAIADTDADLRLVVAGPRGWGSEDFDEAVRSCAARDRIVETGWVGDEERAALLRGALLLAYPSIYEGFGLPPLEAMSVGTPVVTTDAGAIPEVVGDAALLVAPRDTDALAGAMSSVLEDPDLSARLRSDGPARAALFSWDSTAAGLAELYHRVKTP